MNISRFDYDGYARLPTTDVKHIPGDTGLPVFGDTFEFLTNYKGLTERKFRKYGPVFRTYGMFQHTIVLLGPDANQAVLRDNAECFSNKLAWDPMLEKIFSNGLMLMDFDIHKYNRKILQTAFKKNAIEAYIGKMTPRITQGLSAWQTGQTLSFYEHIKRLLLDVAAEVFLGLEIGEEAAKINQSFIDAVDASVAVLRVPHIGRTWQRGLNGRSYLEKFIGRHVDAKRQSEGADFFSHICRARDDDGGEFTKQAIVDHLIFLLFAAHDTTTSTLCSIIYSLAKNTQWQQRLRDEYNAVGKDWLEYNDLAKLETTELVFREALRMYPPLPTIPRRCIKEIEILGYRIPRNAGVGISPLFTHYMEEYWTSPQRFDPERFSPARAEDKKHFFQFLPFGGGHHKCLGMIFAEVQSKLFLFKFLRNYRVSVQPGYDMRYSIVPMSLPTDGLPITIEKIR